jgi:hypothetical protein
MVNVLFTQILHSPFFVFRQVFWIGIFRQGAPHRHSRRAEDWPALPRISMVQERGRRRIKQTLETPQRGPVRASKIIYRKQKWRCKLDEVVATPDIAVSWSSDMKP